MAGPPLHRDFAALLDGLAGAEPRNGIRLIDRRFNETSCAYPELIERVRRQAGRFLDRGVEPGRRVLVSLSTDLDVIGAFFALIYLGALPLSVPAPMLSQTRDAHRRWIQDLVDDIGVDHVLATADLSGVECRLGPLPLRLPDGPGSVAPVGAATVDSDAPAFVQFSSGSTSHPKGSRITHRNLLHNLGLMVDNDGRTSECVVVSWLPLCHDMGLVGCLLSNLVHANPLVLMDPLCFMLRPASWLIEISRSRGNLTAVPNFALDVCTDRIREDQLEGERLDLSCFRYIYCGSEPVRVDSIRRFEERFSRYGLAPGTVRPVYGMSEATLIVTAPPQGESVVATRVDGVDVPSVGRPLGDFEIRIRDDDGVDRSDEGIGEIWLRGTSVTPGYLAADGGGDALHDGWLPTGDLGRLDGEGRLYVTGRKTDLIIHQGRNFYGHDIAGRVEERLGLPAGKTFVFQLPADDRARIVLFASPVRPSDDPARYEADLRRAVLEEFGLVIDDVRIVRKLPKTTSGKINRRRCAELYREAGRDADA